jgi:hypothetical protein
MNAYRIKQWDDGAAEREAAYQSCLDHEQARGERAATKQVAAASNHLWWEKWLLSGTAGLLSLVIGTCAPAVNDLLLALLAIFLWRLPKPAVQADEPPKPVPPKGRRARSTWRWPQWLTPGAPAEAEPVPVMAREVADE